MKLLAFDLENTPMLSYHWGRWGQNIRPVQTVEESRVLCFGAKWIDGPYVFKAAYEHGENEMLDTIHNLLSEADAVISWNGIRHDSKKIRTEFVQAGLPSTPEWRELDLMRVAKRQFAFSSNSLDHVARQLGVGQKVSHEGFFEIIPKVMAGDAKARRDFARYQKQDVLLLEKLYKRLLPWIPKSMHPNAAVIDGLDFACRCGSQDVIRKGYMHTNTGKYPRFRCLTCGSWNTSKTRVASTELRPA